MEGAPFLAYGPIYRFLPGFRDFAVFEKINRFLYTFLDGCYREGVWALARAQIPLLYIKLCIYRGWQASHRKCAISDIAIISARTR